MVELSTIVDVLAFSGEVGDEVRGSEGVLVSVWMLFRFDDGDLCSDTELGNFADVRSLCERIVGRSGDLGGARVSTEEETVCCMHVCLVGCSFWCLSNKEKNLLTTRIA